MSFRPALIIGLGGTGFKIAKDLESRLDLCGADTRIGPVRFLYADSDSTDFPGGGDPRYVHLTVDAYEVVKAIRDTGDYNDLKVKTWHHPQLTEHLLPGDFAVGVNGKRPNGRLAFLASATIAQFCQGIDQELVSLRAANPDDKIVIAVVASAGGGTGSGCFIDCGYLVQYLAQNLGYHGHVQVDGFLLVAAQGLAAAPNRMYNSQAIVRELDHFMDRRVTFKARYPAGDLPQLLGAGGPYTNLFLAAPKDEQGRVLATAADKAMDIVAWRTSDFLFVRLIRDAAVAPNAGAGAPVQGPAAGQANLGEIDARLDVVRGNEGPGGREDPLGYPMNFFTFGCGLRHFPAEGAQVIFRDRLRADLVTYWLDPDTASAATKQTVQGAAANLRRELGLTELREVTDLDPGPDFVADPRASISDKVYGGLVRGDGGGANQVDLEKYFLSQARTRTDVDLVVKEPEAGGVIPQSGQPGFLTATLDTRRTAEENRQFDALRAPVLEAAADPDRGPKYAESLLSVLKVDLEVELRQVNRVMQAPLPGESDTHSGGHPLLLFWSGASRQRDAEDAAGPLAAYANAQYERVVLRRKRILLVARQKQVESLRRELESFRSVLDRWKLQENARRGELERRIVILEGQGEALPALDGVKRVVYPREYLETKYIGVNATYRARIDQQMLGPILGHLKTGADWPADLAPFNSLDTHTRATVEVLQGESVLELLETQGVQPRDGADKMVAQAQNLLHMNLTAADYARFLTGPPHEQFPHTPWHRYFGRGLPDIPRWSAAVEAAFAAHPSVGPCMKTVLDTTDISVAAVASFRSSFPTRICFDFLPEVRERWLQSGDMSIHFIDRSVMPPLPLNLRQEAEGLLILAELLFFKYPDPGITITNLGATRTYIIADPNAQGVIVNATIPSDFAQATRRLAYNDALRRCLRQQFLQRQNDPAQAGPWHQRLSQSYIEWNNRLNALPDQAARNDARLTVEQLTNVPLRDATISLLEGAKTLLHLDIRPPGVDWFAQDPNNGQYHCRHCFRVIGNQQPGPGPAQPDQHEDRCSWYRIQTNKI